MGILETHGSNGLSGPLAIKTITRNGLYNCSSLFAYSNNLNLPCETVEGRGKGGGADGSDAFLHVHTPTAVSIVTLCGE